MLRCFSEFSVFFLSIYQCDIALVSLRRFVEQREDTVTSGKRHDDTVELLADLRDRHVKALVKGQKARKLTKGQTAKA